MRPITGADVLDFYSARHDLLVLAADGEFDHIDVDALMSTQYGDGRANAYDYVVTDNGDQVQVLLERDTIKAGEWFPDALTDDGDLIHSVADEMADIINADGILPSRALKAVRAGEHWTRDNKAAQESAARRAAAVAEVVAYCGGNQSKASRVLGLDQSTVNKLVKKAAAQTLSA